MSNIDSHEEIECKYLDVNKDELIEKLVILGAKHQFTRLFKRYVFDYPDLRMHKEFSWLRLRDEGDKVTMTYKQRLGVTGSGNDSGMKEIETEVSSLEQTANILKAIGLKPKFYEENERSLYILDGVEVAIDSWPLLPPYVEIEGDSWEALDVVARKLGFDPDNKQIYSTNQIYHQHGIDEHEYSVLTFKEQIKK